MTIYATLPIPPTANHLFPTNCQGRRFISKEYAAWRLLAYHCLKGQNIPAETIKGRLQVKYSFYFPDKRRRDLANFEKGISDFLVTNKVIEDDSHIDDLRLIRLCEGSKGFVYIEIGVIG